MKNIFRKLVSFALVLCFGVSLVACGNDNSLSQKETDEYTAKVVESIDLVSGYTFSGAVKATQKTTKNQKSEEGTEELEVSGYVYASGDRLVDLTLLATTVQKGSDYDYDEDADDYKEIEVYEYSQVYFNQGKIYVRKAQSATKNRTELDKASWELTLELPVYELPEEELLDVVDDNGLENDDYDEPTYDETTEEEPQMPQINLMTMAMGILSEVANAQFDAKEAINFVVSALGDNVKGKLENGEVSLYVTHNYAQAINNIIAILARDAKSSSATLETTINDVMKVIKEEFGLNYEGKFTDIILSNLNKILYKEVVVDETTGETEKVSNTVAGLVALFDEFLENSGSDVTLEQLVGMIPAELTAGLGIEIAEGETLYSTLMAMFGEMTIEDMFYQYVEPMIKLAMSGMLGGDTDGDEDVINYDADGDDDDQIDPTLDEQTEVEEPQEPSHLIDYMAIGDLLAGVMQMPSSYLLGSVMSSILDQNGKALLNVNEVSYYVAVVATTEGGFAGFDLKLNFAASLNGTSTEAAIAVNFRVAKITDKTQLEQVNIVDVAD